LLGVRPRWDAGSSRVAGFDILPLAVLNRPRVDVTLRISGLFRDVFPAQIALFDDVVREVAALTRRRRITAGCQRQLRLGRHRAANLWRRARSLRHRAVAHPGRRRLD